MEGSAYCPECQCVITKSDVFPNYALDEISKNTMTASLFLQNGNDSFAFINKVSLLFPCCFPFIFSYIFSFLDKICSLKRKLEREEKDGDNKILLEFLQMAQKERKDQKLRIDLELAKIDKDIKRIRASLNDPNKPSNSTISSSNSTLEGNPLFKRPNLEVPVATAETEEYEEEEISSSSSISQINFFNMKKIKDYYEDLVQCYISTKELDSFESKLDRIVNTNRFKTLSNIQYGDAFGSINIISSIEFDRKGSLFATAGVSRRIRLYDYYDCLRDDINFHIPIREIPTKSKISSLSWNPYLNGQIAAADYEGLVTIWDVQTGQFILPLEEHERRAWTVHFNPRDPYKLASGSDDTTVRIWSTRQRRSLMTIDGRANVCSVQWHPNDTNIVSFGSADHNSHVYDIRQHRKPLYILRGHKKAVSYVRYFSNGSLLSASTDCSLKLWEANDCIKTYSGHQNEKNFVGMSIKGDLILCGSESNNLYTYHKDMPKPIGVYKFSIDCPITGEEIMDNNGLAFISSVGWRNVPDESYYSTNRENHHDNNIFAVANSQGCLKIIQIY